MFQQKFNQVLYQLSTRRFYVISRCVGFLHAADWIFLRSNLLFSRSVRNIGISFGNTDWRIFADRFGLKKSVVLGHFISAVSCFPVALFSASYSVFLLWSVLSAICTTLNSGSVEALQYESLRDVSREAEYTKLRGRLAAIGGISMPVGAFIGGVLCENIGFDKVVALGGLTGLLITAVFVSMSEPERVELAREKSTSQNIYELISENLRFIKRDRELTGVIIAGAVVFAAYNLINYYSQPCLEEAGIQSYRIVGLVSGGSDPNCLDTKLSMLRRYFEVLDSHTTVFVLRS